MNLSIAASLLLLLGPSAVSAIFPAPLELRKQGECIDGHKKDLRGEAMHPPSLKVEELVLTEEECQQLVNTTTEEEFDNGSTVDGFRFYTKINVAEDLYQKLRDPSLARNGNLEMPISRVHESSMPHRDGYYGNGHLGVPEGALVEEEVTMIFLNDNFGASFVYGEEKVPVKCGTKVTFNGGHTHNTELLAGGTVKFVGPLSVSTGLNCLNYDGQCENLVREGGAACSCSACDAEKGDPSLIDPTTNTPSTKYSCCNPSVVQTPVPGQCVDPSEYAQNPSLCPPVSSKGGKSTKSQKSTKGPKSSKAGK